MLTELGRRENREVDMDAISPVRVKRNYNQDKLKAKEKMLSSLEALAE